MLPALGGAWHWVPIFPGPVEVMGWLPTDVATQRHLASLRHSSPGGVDLDDETGLVWGSQGNTLLPAEVGVPRIASSTLFAILAGVTRFTGGAAVAAPLQALARP